MWLVGLQHHVYVFGMGQCTCSFVAQRFTYFKNLVVIRAISSVQESTT